MSTRSGKRIHATSRSPIIDTEMAVQNDRKTRSKKHKENIEVHVKKRHNYVSYPDEDTASVSNDASETVEKVKRSGKMRRNTLKDHNLSVNNVPLACSLESNNNNNTIRKSRRGKKVIQESENVGCIVNIQYAVSESVPNEKKRSKKKKKDRKKDSLETFDVQDKEQMMKKNCKKKMKGLNSMLSDQEAEYNNPVDDTCDSFHSAAGSPVNINHNENHCPFDTLDNNSVDHTTEENLFSTDIKSAGMPTVIKTTDISIKKRRTFEINELKNKENNGNLNATFDKSPDMTIASNKIVELATKRKRKSRVKDRVEKTEISANEDKLNSTFDKILDVPTPVNTTVDVSLRKRSSTKNCTIDNMQRNDPDEGNLNTTFDKTDNLSSLNTTIDVPAKKKRKSSIKNSTFEKDASNETEISNKKSLNATFECANTISNVATNNLIKQSGKFNVSILFTAQDSDKPKNIHKTSNDRRKSSIINGTSDIIEKDWQLEEANNVNNIFDTDTTGPQNTSINNKSFNRKKSLQSNKIPNDTQQIRSSDKKALEDNVKTKNLDTTFNNSHVELNTTFDTEKISENLFDSKKSSLISSDATVNVTFDKSGDNSRISITSDESKTENILNHTPVLIESSIDESLMSEDKSPVNTDVPVTPLKRQGTFTKEVSDIVMSPKLKGSAEKTPVKDRSSPGSTPFPFSKSSHKENVKLNVTRSIEKSMRRSSIVEAAPRQTRVMFCSPANNPALVSQVKGRVIKSNLKGSNKSFVFDNSVSSEARAVRRKRSLTVGAAGEAETRAKRKRLGDELQQSVDRLSRPRTQSAAAKLSEPGTPSKKVGTPSKARPESKVSRTKLPNFAALHQKQFARMESLDECQQRRARRARQLLTPTGSVGLLERISPKGTPPEPAPPAKEPPSKLHTPSKPKPLTLESLIPRYTKFGFKLKVDGNPFSAAAGRAEARSAAGAEARSVAAVGAEARSAPPRPSLAGAAGGRREAARQTVMREKSFSEKRSVKRDETRTIIRGVRTNRRFELQMKMRNVKP